MIDTIILGKRLRFFRERNGISQFDLEMQLDASPGSLSRIESGRTNPKKETLFKLARLLKLNSREQDYLFGAVALPASKSEIETAKEYLKDLFNTKGVLAYLLDERLRFHAASESFYKFLKIEKSQIAKYIGRSFIELVLNPEVKILKSIDTADVESVLFNFLERFYVDCNFMVDDEYYLQGLTAIKSNKVASKIWNEVVLKAPSQIQHFEKRNVTFKLGFISIPLYYSDEPLLSNRRFEVIQYSSSSEVVKFISKLL